MARESSKDLDFREDALKGRKRADTGSGEVSEGTREEVFGLTRAEPFRLQVVRFGSGDRLFKGYFGVG